jgi:hypothetical protein
MSRRLTALVIGNSEYPGPNKLKNPANDAEDFATELEKCGFSVIKAIDYNWSEMDQALKHFKKSLLDNDVGLFYFAGHGMQIDGENYLIAIDSDTAGEDEVKYSSLPLNRVIDVMESAPTSTSIVILDACRDNPFDRSWTRSSSARGLAPVYAPRGTLIAYSTSPGQTASDGAGRNGSYTAALLQHIATPDCSVEIMFKRVRNTLNVSTKSKQISWEHTSLSGEFYFNLSIGARIDDYSDTALRDGLFVLDDKKKSHGVIRALKSCTWLTQNPAIEGFSAEFADKASVDSLFVLGRNIYQASCGGSHGAISYLSNFVSRTSRIDSKKRKALLDGMLFEIFFDSKAKLRHEFKIGKFHEVFLLQQHLEFSDSFEFIAECLLPDIGRFYMLPGKPHKVVVDVKCISGASANSHVLESIHLGGHSLLWLEDPDYAPEPGEVIYREKLRLSKFEKLVSDQIVVPAHLLTINYLSFKKVDIERIEFPYGWTIRKH